MVHHTFKAPDKPARYTPLTPLRSYALTLYSLLNYQSKL